MIAKQEESCSAQTSPRFSQRVSSAGGAPPNSQPTPATRPQLRLRRRKYGRGVRPRASRARSIDGAPPGRAALPCCLSLYRCNLWVVCVMCGFRGSVGPGKIPFAFGDVCLSASRRGRHGRRARARGRRGVPPVSPIASSPQSTPGSRHCSDGCGRAPSGHARRHAHPPCR